MKAAADEASVARVVHRGGNAASGRCRGRAGQNGEWPARQPQCLPIKGTTPVAATEQSAAEDPGERSLYARIYQ